MKKRVPILLVFAFVQGVWAESSLPNAAGKYLLDNAYQSVSTYQEQEDACTVDVRVARTLRFERPAAGQAKDAICKQNFASREGEQDSMTLQVSPDCKTIKLHYGSDDEDDVKTFTVIERQ